jgi:peroxiredoxin
MAATPSTMVSLGTEAPDFNLPDTISGKTFTFQDLKGRNGTLIMFICNHCKYVKHVNKELIRLANEYSLKGVNFIAISSNDTTQFPEDSPELMKKTAHDLGYPFPYLYDESQDVARKYDAACTPDFFLYDQSLKLVYRGQFDDSRPGGNVPVTGADLRAALNSLLAGKPISNIQKPSIGCNIKWKS